jgi:branched-chain amino acid transport system ATP-binding protein
MRFGGLYALRGVSLTCQQGEILGLIGPNGSGKTTLFNVITGFLRPQSGSVFLDEVEITGWEPHRICHLGIARTYQVVRPFASLSARENVEAGIAFGGGRSDGLDPAAEVERLLTMVGLVDQADRPARSLTLVQRKRLEVARALGTQPRLLLLDEVVAGLNPSETEGVLSLIADLRRGGLTVILIEHNMRVIMGLSDRVVVLHHGEKLAEGPPRAVSEDAGVIAAYLGQAGSAEVGL